MLRNVLIMASSGIVLFSKEFANAIAQVGACYALPVYHLGKKQESPLIFFCVLDNSPGWSDRSRLR